MSTPSKQEKKIVAVDYKGKHFILCDEDCIDDMDILDENIAIQHEIDHNLENHVSDCHYYGIPAYIGNDSRLKEKILDIERKLSADLLK